MAGAQYSILVNAKLETDKIEEQLSKLEKKERTLKFKADDSSLKKIDDSAQSASGSMKELGLTFQESNLIFSRSVEVINSMADRVYALNSALVEFAKVSDLSGESLDNYLSKLQQMGGDVARTGKPKCLSPNVGMVNQHYRIVQNPVKPKAYSTTMIA